MRLHLTLTILISILVSYSSCSEDEPIISTAPDITLGNIGLNLTTAFARYERIDSPDGAFVSISMVGDNATIDNFGQINNLPTDLVRFSLRIPNTDGNLANGTYPVIRALPNADLYVSSGGAEANHDGSFSGYEEMEAGSITIAVDGNLIQVTFNDVTIVDFINAGGSSILSGSTQVDLVLLP